VPHVVKKNSCVSNHLHAFARVFSPVGATLWLIANSQKPTAKSQPPTAKKTFAQSQKKYYLYALIESFIEKNFLK